MHMCEPRLILCSHSEAQTSVGLEIPALVVEVIPGLLTLQPPHDFIPRLPCPLETGKVTSEEGARGPAQG